MISDEDKKNLVVGYKQVLKAAKNKKCTKIFIAADCSASISDSLKDFSGSAELIPVSTMRELGSLCGIDVPASCAAVMLL